MSSEKFYAQEINSPACEIFCTDFIQDMNAQHYKKENEPWMVAGNSIGGLTALGVARAVPQIIQGVVIFACAGGMSSFRYADIPWYLWPFVFFILSL